MTEKLSIEQLLAMTPQDQAAYLKTLPEAERGKVDRELFKAVSDQTVQKLVDNLNSNA